MSSESKTTTLFDFIKEGMEEQEQEVLIDILVAMSPVESIAKRLGITQDQARDTLVRSFQKIAEAIRVGKI